MINPAVFRRGTLLTEIRFIPNQIINVLLKDYIRNLLKPSPQSSSFIKFSATFLSGYIAGAISMILTYPLDVISTRLTVDVSQPRTYQGTLHCISSLVLCWLIVFKVFHLFFRVAYKGSFPGYCLPLWAWQSIAVFSLASMIPY